MAERMERDPEFTVERRKRGRLAADTGVLVGVGAFLTLLATAVGMAVLVIVSLEDDASDLSNRHVQYAAAVHEAALSAKAMANEQRGFLLSGDSAYLEQLDADAVDARLAFALAERYAVEDVERDAVMKARREFDRWLRALRADIAAYRDGRRQVAVEASLGSTRALRKTYERSLADAYALGVRSISAATTSLSDSASRSVTVLLVYLVVALAIGVAVGFWIVRTVLQPAFVLSHNAIEVLRHGRMLVAEDESGSHHGVAVEVPVDVINALAESALEAREALRPGRTPLR